MGEPARVYDPFDYELDEDPYPTYHWMLEHAPLYRNEQHDFWALTRFDDVHAALIDCTRFSSTWGTSIELMDGPKDDWNLLIFMDPPRHNRHRALVSKAFTPRSIGTLEAEVRRIATLHLTPLEDRDRFDVVKEFTARLPMDVISAMLGIPESDRRWVQETANLMLHREPDTPKPTRESMQANASVAGYFSELIADRRKQPRDDMVTRLAEVELEDEQGRITRLSDQEIVMFMILLGTAGNETVMKLLATAVLELHQNPDQRRILVDDPAVIPNAVEETLRYDPPSQYQGRVTAQDVEIHGQKVPAGQRVLLINGASGRDPRKFPDPDRYDVRREIDLHLGFGYGRHLCLGASLARLESRIAIEELLRRFPDYHVPEEGRERMHSSNVRGFMGLLLEPVRG